MLAGFYNWFNGNQSSIFSVVASDAQLYDINVEGSLTILVGDQTIYANVGSPGTELEFAL